MLQTHIHKDFKRLGLPEILSLGVVYHRQLTMPLQHHRHEGAYELVFMVRGTFPITLRDGSFRIVPGQCFVTPRDEWHSGMNVPLEKSHFYYLQLRLHPSLPFLGLDRVERRKLDERLSGMRLVTMPSSGWGQSLDRVAELHGIRENGPEALALARFELRARILGLLQGLFDAAAMPARRPVDALMGEIVVHLEAQIAEAHRLSVLAKQFRLSPSRFRSRFKAHTGFSFPEYIGRRRIAKAEALLAEGRTITETAFEVGFASSDYFSKVYRTYMGCSPREGRRRKVLENRRAGEMAP